MHSNEPRRGLADTLPGLPRRPSVSQLLTPRTHGNVRHMPAVTETRQPARPEFKPDFPRNYLSGLLARIESDVLRFLSKSLGVCRQDSTCI